MSPIVINVPIRASLAVETKDLLFLWFANLTNKSNVCKQISSLKSEYNMVRFHSSTSLLKLYVSVRGNQPTINKLKYM